MIAFWAAAGFLAAAAAGLILQRAAAASRAGLSDPTVSLYRRQLDELDELAGRGLLAEAERKGAHAEAARRLLAAADRPSPSWTADASLGRLVAAAAGLVAALAAGLYLLTGSPGANDQPFAGRLKSWRGADPSTLDAPRMAVVLKAVTAERPGDLQAWRYRAMAQAASGDAAGAARSLRRALDLAPQRADLWEALGQMLLPQGEGDDTVPPSAQAAFREALKRDPKSVIARFHLARARILGGQRQEGLAQWRSLLADLPKDDPDRESLSAAIAAAERPAAPDQQLVAIQGMVAGLAAQLEARPDDPNGWIRLVRSYAVLGDAAKRDTALRQARARFAARPDVLADLAVAAGAEPMR